MKNILERIFPAKLDQRFPGQKVALWVFYPLTALTLWRSQHHLFAEDGGAQSIANIPLDTYPDGAAGTVIAIFALWGLSQLIIAMIYLAAAVRYRSLIPFLYLLFILEYAVRTWSVMAKPIEAVGSTPGIVANVPFILIGTLMFGLSLWAPKKDQSKKEKTL